MSFENYFNSESKSNLLNNSQSEYQSNKNSPFSPVSTSFSTKQFNKKDKIMISDFRELVKPTPIYSLLSFDKNYSCQKGNLKQYNIFLDLIKINTNNSTGYDTSLNFLGKKRNLNTKELLFQNNKNAEIEKAEEDFNINKSAFKKIEIKDNFNKSAFNKKVYIKKKLFKKNKIKADLSNKIIINEANNINIKEKENEIKLKPKIKLFKSIKCDKKNQKGKISIEIFKVEEEDEKRRGRKPKNETSSKRVHDAFDYDNILRKIQVHYLTFIISLTNDLIESFCPNNKDLKFKNLSYDLKKIVNHSYVEKLKENKIGDILKFKASSKNRRFKNDINEHIYQQVCILFPFMNNYFNMNYLELFKQYYFKSNKIINFEGKIINLSKKTRVFSDLLKKNKKAAEKIQQIAINNFIEKKDKQTIFVIKK